MDLDTDSAPARGLRRYITLVADALALSGPGWTIQLDPPISAYVALDQRLPAFPTRDTALLWDELHGWALAVETASGEDLLVIAYHGGDIVPAPRLVAQFAVRLLTSPYDRAGPVEPPCLRDDLLAQRLAGYAAPTAHPVLSTRLLPAESVTVLQVRGEIDMTNATKLLHAVSDALELRPAVLIIDLTEVTFLTSAGLHALLHAHHSPTPTMIRIVAATTPTRLPLRATGLDTQLAIYPTLRQALADPPPRQRPHTAS